MYIIKRKSEALDKLKVFQAEVAPCGEKIGVLKSDRRGEYTSEELKDYLKSQKIKQELTSAECLEQNGISERMNRTLCESAHTMLHHAGLPKKFWAEAIATGAYIRNRVSTSALNGNITPYEKWSGKKPDVSEF